MCVSILSNPKLFLCIILAELTGYSSYNFLIFLNNPSFRSIFPSSPGLEIEVLFILISVSVSFFLEVDTSNIPFYSSLYHLKRVQNF